MFEKEPSWTTTAPLPVTRNCNPSGLSFCYPSGLPLRRRVRKRGGRAELGAVLIFVVVITISSIVAEDGYANLIWAGAAVFALYMEWWSWRTVPWDVVEREAGVAR